MLEHTYTMWIDSQLIRKTLRKQREEEEQVLLMVTKVVAAAIVSPLVHVADYILNKISSLLLHGSLHGRETREGQPPHVQTKAVYTLQITDLYLLMALIHHYNTSSV